MPASVARGAYGFRIEGLHEADRHLTEVPPDWPVLRIEFARPATKRDPQPAGTGFIDETRAELWLGDAGRIELCRNPITVRFETDRTLSPDAIVHPFLGLPAAIAARWLGRLTLHGGAFVLGGRAWGLLGDRESGKSATLAALMAAGLPVLSDDILICEGTALFAGPRSIDLREAASEVAGGEALGVVGSRERWRLRPSAGTPRLELGGFIHLRWGEAIELAALDPSERLRRLALSLALRPNASEAMGLLELSTLDARQFSRPADVSQLHRTAGWLADQLVTSSVSD